MNGTSFFIGVILPYLTIIVFLVGMGYRFYGWFKLPSPPMTLYPTPSDKGAKFIELLKETLFFKSLFCSDKVFWTGAFIFHVMLALIFIGHFRVVAELQVIWNIFKLTPEQVNQLTGTLGGGAGAIIFITVIYLLFRRIVIPRVQEITASPDFLTLLLILLVVITGNAMRFSEHFDLNITRQYFAALFTFSNPLVFFPQDRMFLLHFLLAQLLIIYIPFSKLLHFGGIFFSREALKR